MRAADHTAIARKVADELRRDPPVTRVAYTTAETALALGVSSDLVYDLQNKGDIPYVYVGALRVVLVDDLLAVLRANRRAAVAR